MIPDPTPLDLGEISQILPHTTGYGRGTGSTSVPIKSAARRLFARSTLIMRRPESEGTSSSAMYTGHPFGFPFAGSKIYKKAGLINSRNRGEELTKLMGKDTAVLMKGHGGSVTGSTLEEATVKAVMMEEAAKIQLLAGLAGGAKPYLEDELADFKHELENLTVQNNRPAGLFERTWAYYKTKVEEGQK